MEDATISQETENAPKQETNGMYMQGKYPSVIDTDDIIFEIGKQIIGNINKEKLLDRLLNKSKMIETAIVEANEEKLAVERKIIELKVSNDKYIETNKKLDAVIVVVRKDLEASKKLYQEDVKEWSEKISYLKVEHEKELANFKNLDMSSKETIKDLGMKIEQLKKEHEKLLISFEDLLKNKNEELNIIKKKKPKRKKD